MPESVLQLCAGFLVNRSKVINAVTVAAAVHGLSCKLPAGCSLRDSDCVSPI